MKVLVTGGNGHLGYNQILNLLSHGYQVRATLRDMRWTQHPHFRDLPVHWVPADLNDQSSLRAAMDGVRGVFHIAAPNHAVARDPEGELRVPIVNGTLNVLQACLAKGVEGVVMTSSCSTMGLSSSKDRPLTEDVWTERLHSPLLKAKLQAERLAWSFCRENGLRMHAVLLPNVIGPGFHRSTGSTTLAPLLKKKLLPPLPAMGFHLVDARDAADAHRRAFESDTTGQRWIAAGEYIQLNELGSRLRHVLPDLRDFPVRLPFWALELINVGDFAGSRIFGWKRSLSRDLLRDFRGLNQHVSTEKIRSRLQWRPRPLEETIREMIEWVERNPDIEPAP